MNTINVQRFRKKPVVIEAAQFNGPDDYPGILKWITDSTNVSVEEVKFSAPVILLKTLEGTMEASPGDWIIRGVKNEFYPIKPDIFDETYEPEEDHIEREDVQSNS